MIHTILIGLHVNFNKIKSLFIKQLCGVFLESQIDFCKTQ
jgi:hypothetical protein